MGLAMYYLLYLALLPILREKLCLCRIGVCLDSMGFILL